MTWYRADDAPRSIARYKDAGKALMGYFRGSRLSSIDAETIEDYKRQRQAIGQGPVTINKELTMLRQKGETVHLHHQLAYHINPKADLTTGKDTLEQLLTCLPGAIVAVDFAFQASLARVVGWENDR